MRPVVVARNAVDGIEADLGEPKNHVRPDGESHRANTFGDEVGIVPVHYQTCHDSENTDSLQDIIVVIVVAFSFASAQACLQPGVRPEKKRGAMQERVI